MKAGLLCGLLVASAVCAADNGVVADGVTRGFIHCRESKAMLALVERLLPHADDRRKVLVETPRRLFGFTC